MKKSTRGTPSPSCATRRSPLFPRKGPIRSPQGVMKQSVFAPVTPTSTKAGKSERSAPRKPANRGSYETFGGAEDQVKSGRKLAMNRNAYETVGLSEPPPKAGTVMALGGPALNRPSYEAVIPGGEAERPEGEGQMPNVVAGGAGSIQVPHETVSGQHEPVEAMDMRLTSQRSGGSPQSVNRRAARRKAAMQAAEREETRPFRLSMWILTAIISILVIGALLAVGVHFAMPKPPKPTSEPPVSGESPDGKYVQERCARDMKKQGAIEGCVYGSAPVYNPKSCGRGECYNPEFALSPNDSAKYFEPTVRMRTGSMSKPLASLFCLASRDDRAPEARVCDQDEGCTAEYTGTARLYNIEHYQGVWRDNCDEINPCWIDAKPAQTEANITKEAIFDDTDLVSRDDCLDETTACKADQVTAAIVWLQHLKCSLNPSLTGTPCEGLPIQLWVCKSCPLTGDPVTLAEDHAKTLCNPSEKMEMLSGKCTVKCGGNDYISMPNGAACAKSSYCFQGACLPAKMKEGARLKKSAECKEQKKKQEDFWKKFVFRRANKTGRDSHN